MYKDESCIYIGMSSKGLTRPTNNGKYYYSTEIRIYVCDNEDEARILETKLIRRLHPFFNTVNNYGKGDSYCEACDKPIKGRVDKRFCSTNCRVVHHKAIQAAKRLGLIPSNSDSLY